MQQTLQFRKMRMHGEIGMGMGTGTTRPAGPRLRLSILNTCIRLFLTAVLVFPAMRVHSGVILTTLHSFHAALYVNGAIPDAPLVHGTDRSFYCATTSGGANG